MNQSCRHRLFSAVLVCFAAASAACTPPATQWQKYNDAGRSAYREAQWSGNKLRYFPEAEKSWVAGLKEAEKFGPQDPRLSISLNNLAVLYEEQLKFSEAEPLCVRAIAFDEKALGPNHPDVATKQKRLALWYMTERKYEQAEPLYQRLLETYEKTNGPDDLNVLWCLETLAEVYAVQGKYALAEPLYKRSLVILEKEHGSRLDETVRKYADLLVKTNRKAEAEILAKRTGVNLGRKGIGVADILQRRLLETKEKSAATPGSSDVHPASESSLK